MGKKEQGHKFMERTGDGRIVLLVDENRETRDFMSNILSNEGYAVIRARNGIEALELMERYSADVVLTDLTMPRMDGLELALTVKSNERLKHIPIVLLSATPMTNSWVALKTFSALLVKPCPLEEVILTLSRVQAPDPTGSAILG